MGASRSSSERTSSAEASLVEDSPLELTLELTITPSSRRLLFRDFFFLEPVRFFWSPSEPPVRICFNKFSALSFLSFFFLAFFRA
jgi:hypothetical protein